MKILNVKESHTLLNNYGAVLIDVREPAEHRAEKIPGSKNIPLSKIKHDDLKDSKDRKIIFHCRTGNRSQSAIKKLDTNSNSDLINMDGGIEAWKDAGFKTKKSSVTILPLNQQVQITIALMILVGLVIYYFITPYGLLLPLLAGLGLLNAGLTGWCGMAMLLSRMPWNQ